RPEISTPMFGSGVSGGSEARLLSTGAIFAGTAVARLEAPNMLPRSRTSCADAIVHVLNRPARHAPIFLRPADYRAFLAIVADGLCRDPVRLVAYSVLPTHWHLVMGPSCPDAV